MAEISVIVPVYNAEKSIFTCISSVINQSFKEWELILVDDGSTDNSGKICDQFAATYENIFVIHKCNGGVSQARNQGIDAAHGRYIVFLDSDDYISGDYLSTLYSNNSYDLVICGFEAQDERKKLLYRQRIQEAHFDCEETIDFAKLYKQRLLYSPYCKLFRNDIIKSKNISFPIDISWGEDGVFVSDYICNIRTLAVIDYIGYYYIKYDQEQSLSTRFRPEIIDMIVKSREYCISNMTSHSGQFGAVKKVCEEDICYNISYFIQKLIVQVRISKSEKNDLLSKYLCNHYVKKTFLEADKYYNDECLIRALKTSAVEQIITTYYNTKIWYSFKQFIYKTLYIKQPEWVKILYQKCKGSKR